MLKPFFLALAVGFGIVWLYRNYKKSQNLAAVTYTDKNGNAVFAGPDVDNITGDYIARDSQPGTVGASQATS